MRSLKSLSINNAPLSEYELRRINHKRYCALVLSAVIALALIVPVWSVVSYQTNGIETLGQQILFLLAWSSSAFIAFGLVNLVSWKGVDFLLYVPQLRPINHKEARWLLEWQEEAPNVANYIKMLNQSRSQILKVDYDVVFRSLEYEALQEKVRVQQGFVKKVHSIR